MNKKCDDELDDFAALGLSAFESWNDPADDIYEEFYRNRKAVAKVKDK